MNDDRFIELYGGMAPVSPGAFFGDNVRMGFGNVILDGTRIGSNCRIGSYCCIDEGVSVGEWTFIGDLTKIRDSVEIGHHAIIGHLVMIEQGAKIGNHVTIQSQCHITKDAVIEDRVFFGPGAIVINTRKISHGRGYEPVITPPLIRYGARIGAGAVILPGVEIGKNAVVGAGSVVTRDVPNSEIWINKASDNGRVQAGFLCDVPFDERL